MSVLQRLLGGASPEASTPGPDEDFWYSAIDAAGAGVPVTVDAAMRVSAVYACVTVLTEDVASLDLDLYFQEARGRASADGLPLARKLSLEPNRWQTSFEWREMCQGHVLLRGNAYNRILAGRDGFVEELVPLNPDKMDVKILPSGARVYEYRDDEAVGGKRTYADSEIFHIPGRDFNGKKGKSVIGAAMDAIGVGAATQRSASNLFSQGMKSPGVLQHPGHLSDEAYKRVQESFAAKNLGVSNWHKPILLEEGLEWKQMGMTSQDAERVTTFKVSLEDIARFFRMPPHKIGILDRATFSNIEHQSLEYVINTLRPWLVRWQQRIRLDLIVSPRLFAVFNDEPLLRGDMKSRYEAHAIGRQWGWENADEIRADFGRNPVADGTGADYWRPMNMARSSDPTAADLATRRSAGALAASRVNAKAALFAESLARRLVKIECDRVSDAARRHAADAGAWEAWLSEFYDGHALEVAQTLQLEEAHGKSYAERQMQELRSAGVVCVESWLAERPRELVELALAG